jgi:membrane protease YdiL (CAAX protease family)
MNGFTRLAGYLGLVLLLGGLVSLAILPHPGRGQSSSLRDDLAWAWVIGYVLIAARLLYLTFRGEDPRTRHLSAVTASVMVIGGGVGGFLAISLLTMTGAAT